MAHSPCYKFPLLVPFSTYLAPSSCERNRPPQSQVARKLVPLCPPLPLYTLPTKFPTHLGFPELNVHLIRATSQTLSPVYNTVSLIAGLQGIAPGYQSYKRSFLESDLQGRIPGYQTCKEEFLDIRLALKSSPDTKPRKEERIPDLARKSYLGYQAF